MSSQEQTTPLSRNYSQMTAHKKICCLFLNWDDATEDKMKEISDMQLVLHERYGAFITAEVVEQADFKNSEGSFWYSIENFIKINDSRDNLLLIFYSGCSYVHERQLFLEPHRHSAPTVRWSESLYRRIASTLLLIFDTTSLRERHYEQFWARINSQRETLGELDKALILLTVNGAETQLLIDTLKLKAVTRPQGFTVSDLCSDIQDRQRKLPIASIYKPHSGKDDKLTDIIFLPLARPKLQLYSHVEIPDPHQQYLRDFTEIHKDGVCDVIKMRMGPDLQEFSTTLGLGLSCVVAIKRFTLKGRRALHLPDQFVKERKNLEEVSRWRHKHILGMLASFESTGGKFKTLNIILPFADGGNLYNFLRLERDSRWELSGYPTSPPSFVGCCLGDWRYAVYRETIGLVDAVAELHSDKNGKFMTHRDIKPSNVLIQKGTFKLADFGLSELKDSDETSKTIWFLGTELYSPPEKEASTGPRLMGRGRDVWALGCVLLEIAVMIRFAFQDPAAQNIIDIFYEERRKWSKEAGIEETAVFHKTMGWVNATIKAFSTMRPGLRRRITLDGMIPIIMKMLEEDQTKRITATDAVEALETHYQSLQADPQLRLPIEVRDNPGGPPVVWNPLDYTVELQGQYAGPVHLRNEVPALHSRQSTGPAPTEHKDGLFIRPPLPRRLTGSFDSTGATGQLRDLGLQDNKRSASEEMDSGNKKRFSRR